MFADMDDGQLKREIRETRRLANSQLHAGDIASAAKNAEKAAIMELELKSRSVAKLTKIAGHYNDLVAMTSLANERNGHRIPNLDIAIP